MDAVDPALKMKNDDELKDELAAVGPGGDLVVLADQLRRMGVDSLLVCRPNGQIQHVVSEHRIRRMAQPQQPGLPWIPDQQAARDSFDLAEGERVRARAR